MLLVRHVCVNRAITRWALLGASAAALSLAAPSLVQAQPAISGSPLDQAISEDPDARMLLQADELVYDYDNERVSAVGDVEIYYQGYTVEAAEVVYDQRTQRVYARGEARISEPDGNVIYAESVELTDDFREGFLEELTLVTPDRTRFAAASADRRDDNVTVFNRGVYTACEPCEERPERAPIWQFKATRIIHDQEEKVVRYEDATFEMFGLPIAYFPYFQHADPTVERKSGFLQPQFHYGSNVGFGFGVPYYFNLAPNYDLTVTPTYFSQQGLLLDGEWRHRLVNGSYVVRGAGIVQAEPDAFAAFQSQRDTRGYLAAEGFFDINEFWQWGFEGHLLSDSKFLDDYYFTSETELTDNIFLTGLSASNYFDARVINYQSLQDYNPGYDNPNAELPVVHPVVDYNYVFDDPVMGGRLSFDANFLSLSRSDADFAYASSANTCPLYNLETNTLTTASYANVTPDDCKLLGVPGNVTRFIAQAEWERSFVTGMGQVITPFASLRGDLYALDLEDPFLDTYGAPVVDRFIATDEDGIARGMAAGGVEGSWPILVSAGWGYQVFEPMAQLIARPDAEGNAIVPNEDAISLVFDDTSLFERDKFSGYDRLEGGTRLNAGLRYRLQTNQGLGASALFGQSYHLAGENPFERGTGLGTDESDYVGGLYVSPLQNVEIGTRVRLDEDDLELMRQDLQVRGTVGPVTGTAIYTDIAADPDRNVLFNRKELQGTGALRITDEWSLTAGGRYELEGPNESQWISQSVGLGYMNECIGFALAYERTFVRDGNIEPDERVTFTLTLRTLTEAQFATSLNED